jgi:hypothetical protein
MPSTNQFQFHPLLRAPIWAAIICMNIGGLVGVAFDKAWLWMAIGGCIGLVLGVVITTIMRFIHSG